MAFRELGGDVVVKPLFGSEGRGLVRVTDPEIAFRTFWTLEQLRAVIYVQRFVANPGFDLRLLRPRRPRPRRDRAPRPGGRLADQRALGRSRRGDRARTHLEALALAASRSVGAVVAGVDLLFDLDRQTWVVLEVNAVPGWRALAGATGVDVAAEILAHLRDSAR